MVVALSPGPAPAQPKATVAKAGKKQKQPAARKKAAPGRTAAPVRGRGRANKPAPGRGRKSAPVARRQATSEAPASTRQRVARAAAPAAAPAPVAVAQAPTPAPPATTGTGTAGTGLPTATPQAATRRRRAAAQRRRRAAAERRRAARLRSQLRQATRGATRLRELATVSAGSLAAPVGATPTPAAGPSPAADRRERAAAPRRPSPERESPVVRRVREIVEVVPGPIKVALALLAALSLVLLGGYLLAMMRSRRLARQRRELLDEVGLLQAALLPPVPERIGAVAASVAYRPADGPGAGGDFYDALALPGGCAGFLLGDLSGHGREALSHTAFMRYTLRAYLEAGLEPRLALRVAERVVGEHLGGSFATVILAVHDPRSGSLTYASAGHPAPIVVGQGEPHSSVPAAGSPPIGWGLSTGLRQTTIPLATGSRALLYTDGLEEAPMPDGGILGRERLTEIAAESGSAAEVLERVAAEAVEIRDDMAACLIAPVAEVKAGAPRREELELMGDEVDDELLTAFLKGCEVPPLEIERARAQAANRLRADGAALVIVRSGKERSRVEVAAPKGEGLETASRRGARLSSAGP